MRFVPRFPLIKTKYKSTVVPEGEGDNYRFIYAGFIYPGDKGADREYPGGVSSQWAVVFGFTLRLRDDKLRRLSP
jgi:hypothetical protein